MKTLTVLTFFLAGLAASIYGQEYKKSDLIGKWYLDNENVAKTTDTLNFKRTNTKSAFTEWDFSVNDIVSISTGRVVDFEKNNTSNDKLIIIDEHDLYRLSLSIEDKKSKFEINDGKSKQHYIILFLNENKLSLTSISN